MAGEWKRYEAIPERTNTTSALVVDTAIAVHRELGPGLLESTYFKCLVHALRKRGARVEVEVKLPIVYDGMEIESAYRIDLLVNDEVIVEVKSVSQIHPVHQAQILSYLKLSGRRVALMINFNVVLLKDGIYRFAN
jgi:GxxExxY protein